MARGEENTTPLPSGVHPVTMSGELSKVSRLGFPPTAGDDEHVVLPEPVRAERDVLPVRAEHRVDVVRLVHRDRPGDAADRLDGPDVAEVAERDRLAVGRDVGRAGEPDRLLCGHWGGEEDYRNGRGEGGRSASAWLVLSFDENGRQCYKRIAGFISTLPDQHGGFKK